MADADEKAKAEKIAAAKKRVEQLKKAKAKKAGTATKKDDAPAAAADKAPAAAEATSSAPQEEQPAAEEESAEPPAEATPATATTPSLSEQSKARSASFRKPSVSGGPLSPGFFSPEGETAPDIYRKHVARIEELEKENKRLAKEAGDSEKRWQKAEEELADLREADGGSGAGGAGAGSSGQLEKLRNEVAALQRQNAQLQTQISRGGPNRHGSSPSISMATPPSAELEAQLASKSSTIETMELEMSRLRAQVERLSVSASTPSEQIAALEEKLARAEKAAALAQRELADLKRNLERTAEKAVKAGSERASAETKVRALERQAADASAAQAELAKKADALEKKVATLTTLHREQDGRAQALRKERDRLDGETRALRERADKLDAENLRLRKKDAAEGGGLDDEGVDELENEELARLQRRVRELEAENTDLRRGIWHERRKELQVGPDDASPAAGRFTNVDLGGGGLLSPGLRKGGAGAGAGGFGDFFTSGLNALTGAGGGTTPGEHHGHDEGFLDDDGDDFDEDAFRKAQEEETKNRIERIKEIKRGLTNWKGWRLDLVENRRGGGEGVGEIFEV